MNSKDERILGAKSIAGQAKPAQPLQKEVQKRYQQDFSRYQAQIEKNQVVLGLRKAA